MAESDITGVILAGGESRRFGEDKTRHRVAGKPMIECVCEVLKDVVEEVRISGRDDIPDRHPGYGPIAGLHAALCEIGTPWVLVVAADMPYLTAGILRQITKARTSDAKAVVARTPDGRLQPLCACYRRDILPVVEEQIRKGYLSMHELLREIEPVHVVDVPAEPLRNVNTRADLRPADQR